MHLSVSYVIKELPEEIGVCFISLFGSKINYWNMFYVGGWYSTMNDILIVWIFYFVHIVGRNVLCSSTMIILLMFIIMCRLIMWYILYSKIMVSMYTSLERHFCSRLFSLQRYDWFSINIHKKKVRKKFREKKLNAWYILQFSYYWPTFRKTMSTPIGYYFY